MTKIALTDDSNHAPATDIKFEQLRIVFDAIPISLFAILVNSTILSLVLLDNIPALTLLIWYLLTNSLSLIRWHYYRQFKRFVKGESTARPWNNIIIITSSLSGACWGMAGIFLFPESNIPYQMFLLFIVTGMSAASISTLSASLHAARAFLWLAISPFIIQFLVTDTPFSYAMVVMTFLFLVTLLSSARRLNHTILESLDIRSKNEVAQQTIRFQANYDELTKLPNRRLFIATLEQEIARSARHKRCGAVFFIDLDRFKAINDSLGHQIGDELLVEVAERIRKRMRKEDTAARLSGDEFVTLLAELDPDPEQAGQQALFIANDLRKLFEVPFHIKNHELHLTISIGVAIFPFADASAAELIQFADVAMYQSKDKGRNRVFLFSQEMQDAVNQRREIEKDLRIALENNQFLLYFQAQFGEQSKLIGAEALLRWLHPDKGMISPAIFIEVAEKTGLIEAIGEWVLRKSCTYLADLRESSDLKLSVNVSPRQFSNRKFVSTVKSILLETGADPHQLKLEITEGMVIDDIDKTIDTMNQLRAIGISFSLDDFGTGYSSLAYLNRLPVDELKIDQSFVRNVSEQPENAVIIETMIVMAKHLNLKVIAEGVETTDELEFLQEKGCHNFQGFYFAKPEPFKGLLTHLK